MVCFPVVHRGLRPLHPPSRRPPASSVRPPTPLLLTLMSAHDYNSDLGAHARYYMHVASH